MLKRALIMLLLAVSSLAAQQAAISQHYKPGDTLHYYVRFEGNPKVERVGVQFNLQGQPQHGQEDLQRAFDVNQPGTTSGDVFEVNGTIPNNVASGTYLLNYAFAGHEQQSHTYRYGSEFNDKITIDIVNDKHFEFPAIKSITPNPPK